ncbi:MAG: hypothetical protein K1X57_00540 [Gemmataceae bacterium]|nr:hypothetical protein [Gemmataceae bacterium]
MTNLAKYLIFGVTVLSFMFLAWSMGLYVEQMPWQLRTKEQAEEIKGLVEARDRADTRWYDANGKVTKLEAEIPQRRAWYAEQTLIATTGKNNAGKAVTPAVGLVDVQNGLVQLKSAGPFQIDGAAALSFDGYKEAIEKQLNEIRETKVKTNKVVTDTTALTTEINGNKPAAEAITAVEKGLRGQLSDAQQLGRNAQLEQQFLQSPLTNDTVELELLKRRQLALEARLKELAQSVRGE